MSRRAPKELDTRVFLYVNALPDNRIVDYLEWTYDRAYGTYLNGSRDAANS